VSSIIDKDRVMSIGYKFFHRIGQCWETRCGEPSAAETPCRTGMVVFLSIIIITAVFATRGHTANLIFNADKKKVVIDPGHGGQDNGSEGPDGTLEKIITLKVARMLAARLDKHYRTVLTRRDDYPVGILDRTSTANHLKADIFISIHTGGSFLHKTDGISIFFFKKTAASAFSPDSGNSKAFEKQTTPLRWDELQRRHTIAGRRLAQSIKTGIQVQKTPFQSKVAGAPLLVLSGADMPAILIEIGYLTNHSEEKALQDPKIVSRLVEGIYQGIVNFFIQSDRLSGRGDDLSE